ncbi:MAG: 4-hydroxy-tetrahydrodipicolinate reductase [Candidatus Diapherotrites archaeon]|jgi:4-hydroxy-tetrahydrodipicolinate reductase|uniref:4-hydroxy-tetrahydrodipicolinate reductase n=1 Tax=Candidatus Iainarchaeum sp. TaxID=3101447 RepID=A0A8T5GDR5_9ARCH|nr:4-hydroxy-tetrahydrodipicolinate reductase [Candidatus Diapherotrites archaeon]
MRIAIIGYGKMGNIIQTIAHERLHDVVTIDPMGKADFKEINEESLKDVDVAIDFTTPTVALENARASAMQGKNIVMGTTGWYDDLEEMKEAVKDIGFIWSGNFSIGVNMFFKIVEEASKVVNNVEDYDASVFETHHNMKKDSPSGTAKMIADKVIENIERKDTIVTDKFDRAPEKNELHVASMRCGKIPGTHTVTFDSQADTIELTHRARGREGFALGAVLAAEFINGKKGFFDINDLMKDIIGGK